MSNYISLEDFLFAHVAQKKGCLTKEILSKLFLQQKQMPTCSLMSICFQNKIISMKQIQEIVQENDQMMEKEIVCLGYLNINALIQIKENVAAMRAKGQFYTLAGYAMQGTLNASQVQTIWQKLERQQSEASTIEKMLPGKKKAHLQSGSYFGRYRIECELGRGGMGAVYQVYDDQLKRTVALKVIANDDVDETQIQRFMQEARATAQLEHPNIVNVFEVGENPQPYFTMEYMEGMDLFDWIQSGQAKPLEAAKFIYKVAEALHVAHQKGIIHRDIKPSNIMITKEGKPKVMDFGLAKVVDTNTNLSQTGAVMGTPAYMSPEQAQGQNVDASSDIYSLGATLYETLTGRPPFQGDIYVNIVMQIVESDPIAPRRLNPDIPLELEAICLKSLEKEPKKRYSDIRMLGRDLKNMIEHRPIIARPATRFTHLKKWIFRNKMTSLLIFCVFFILFTCVIGYIALEKNHYQKILIVEKKRAQAEKKRAQAEKKRADEEKKRVMDVKKALALANQEKQNSIKAAKITLQMLRNVYWKKEWIRQDKELLNALKEGFNELERLGVIQQFMQKGKDSGGLFWLYGLVFGDGRNKKETVKGLDAYNQILKLDPNDGKAYANRAMIYLNLKNYKKAEEDLNKAIKIAPNLASAYSNRASLYFILKRYQEAEKDFTKTIELNPNEAPAYGNRGLMYINLKKYKKAEKDYDKFLQLAPKHATG